MAHERKKPIRIVYLRRPFFSLYSSSFDKAEVKPNHTCFCFTGASLLTSRPYLQRHCRIPVFLFFFLYCYCYCSFYFFFFFLKTISGVLKFLFVPQISLISNPHFTPLSVPRYSSYLSFLFSTIFFSFSLYSPPSKSKR